MELCPTPLRGTLNQVVIRQQHTHRTQKGSQSTAGCVICKGPYMHRSPTKQIAIDTMTSRINVSYTITELACVTFC